MMEPRYIDIHAHLNLPQFADDRGEVIARMREEGVWANIVGVDLETSRQAVALAEEHEELFATVGLHPVDNPDERFDAAQFAALAAHPKVVAVGECGFDFYHASPRDERERARQRERFAAHLALALEQGKPLMLHCRPSRGTMDAYEETLAVLERAKETAPQLAGNAHFFVGDRRIAERFFALGFSVSFPGIVTFARDFDEVIRAAPRGRIHAETDAPFAAPEPHRGRRNEPAYLPRIVEALAEVRREEVEALRRQLIENARASFAIAAS